MTGRAAAGPIFPRPRTAEPSVTTATVLRLIVKRRASEGSAAIACEIRATPGVYARERSSRVLSGTFEVTSIFPPRWSKNVRSLTLRTVSNGFSEIAAVMRSACSLSWASHETSIVTRSIKDSTTSSAVMDAPAAVIAAVISATG